MADKKKKEVNVVVKDEIENYSDEIDLFELFRKIWKWKWFVIGFTLIITVSVYVYLSSKPDTYTINAKVNIGKIAGTPIDNYESIKYFLQSISNEEKNDCFNDLITSGNTEFIDFKSTSIFKDKGYNCINENIKLILLRHDKIYDSESKRIKNDLKLVDKQKVIIGSAYYLDIYNFRSFVVKKPVLTSSPDDKKIISKVIISFILAFFFGIFLVLLIDYIIIQKKKFGSIRKQS